MNSEIQEKFNIAAVDHEYDDHDDYGLTITVNASGHTFHVQTTDGTYNKSKGCWIFADGSCGENVDGGDYVDVYGDDSDEVFDTIINVAEAEAKRIIKNKELERVRDNDESGEIEAKAEKIAAIVGGNVDDYLIMSSVMSNADKIDINSAMISLQIKLGCSQSQSSDIVNLFL